MPWPIYCKPACLPHSNQNFYVNMMPLNFPSKIILVSAIYLETNQIFFSLRGTSFATWIQQIQAGTLHVRHLLGPDIARLRSTL